jgi:hypothetical protein
MEEVSPAWGLALGAAGLYCLVRALFDIRDKRYLWAALGLAAAVVIILMPVGKHTATVTVAVPSEN